MGQNGAVILIVVLLLIAGVYIAFNDQKSLADRINTV